MLFSIVPGEQSHYGGFVAPTGAGDFPSTLGFVHVLGPAGGSVKARTLLWLFDLV